MLLYIVPIYDFFSTSIIENKDQIINYIWILKLVVKNSRQLHAVVDCPPHSILPERLYFMFMDEG